jgi:hypothetical protein
MGSVQRSSIARPSRVRCNQGLCAEDRETLPTCSDWLSVSAEESVDPTDSAVGLELDS